MDMLVFYTYQDFDALDELALGAVAPRSSDDIQLQVRNASDTYQADTVTVAVGGGDADHLYLSADGDTFTQSIDVGTIPPGAGCLPFWLRRVTPSSATGTGAATLSATPAAWTDPVDTSVSGNVSLDDDVELTAVADDSIGEQPWTQSSDI